MDVRERLARLGYSGARSTVVEQVDGPRATGAPRQLSKPERSSAAAAPRAFAQPPKLYPDVADLLAGAYRGDCFVAESSYPLDHAYAGTAVGALLEQSPEAFALLTGDERLRFMDPARTVLIDCETTGLAGGTGTYAFLIGLGYFDERGFRVDQVFMREPSEERAALQALGDVLGRFDAVISFNGKCFDWPLMETRHVYARLPLEPRLHLDLLFPSRRLFKRRLGACGLTDLERGVLGMPTRQGDVPGWLIPQLYFDYLRRRDGRPLVPVFEHNRLDVLTMLSLAVRLANHVDDPPAVRHALDSYGLGRVFEDAGEYELAIGCFERALPDLPDPEEASTRIAAVYKRLRETERAVAIWQRLVDGRARTIYPYVELAKHHEHRSRRPAAALDLTQRALALHGAALAYTSPARHATERAELERRRLRLSRKLA